VTVPLGPGAFVAVTGASGVGKDDGSLAEAGAQLVRVIRGAAR
jgi:hypothetical protein